MASSSPASTACRCGPSKSGNGRRVASRFWLCCSSCSPDRSRGTRCGHNCLTRGQVGPGDPAESHPGIDIAVPTGTAVRAAAAGVVAQAGTDPAYGLFVLLRHTAGYETMYGHASRLVVREGDSVVAGQVIAL